jgi:hypothetical protein
LTAVLALAAGAPAWAAPPFGNFGGIVGGGNSGAGLIPLHGWALADSGVERVDIYVARCAPPVAPGVCNRGQRFVAGTAIYGRSRPRVTASLPGYPDSDAPGFGFFLDSTRYLNGLHEVTARVRSISGETRFLNSRLIEFLNLEHNLVPFGEIDFPDPQAELYGDCNGDNPTRRWSIISGYALDAGEQESDTGVAYVELLIDGALWANTDLNCRHDPSAGGMTDCYGLRRFDVERLYPSLKDSPHSGFRFAVDVGFLLSDPDGPGPMDSLMTPGSHVPDELSFGEIFLPTPVNMQAGKVLVGGWALDFNGVHSVQLLVDGTLHTHGSYGHSAPGIDLSNYPGYPDILFPAWVAFVDTTILSNGQHFLELQVTDDLGNRTLVSRKRFVVNNPEP